MSITHDEARRLIQFRADDALKDIDRHLLEAHLSTCVECQKYASATHNLEATLQHLMQKRWDQKPLPLPARNPARVSSIQFTQSIFFATRIIAMGVICVAFLFNIWQSTQSGGQRATPSAAEVPLIPTPSMQTTGTGTTDQTCASISYEVKENDTIESIATRFSVPAQEIRKTNEFEFRTGTLNTSMKLSIPVCSPTPSGTPNTVTTTFTPLLGSNTLTPVNESTQ